MICKALHDLFLLFLWPLILSFHVLKSCWPPHCSSSRTGQSSPGVFFAFFPPSKVLCSESHPGHSLISLRFHHTNACPDHIPHLMCACVCVCVWVCVHAVTQSCLTLLRPHLAHQASPWDFSGKNTGVGSCFLLQGIFLAQGSNLHLLWFLHW